MRLSSLPENLTESIALFSGIVPTPLMDTLVALLLAKTVIAATAVGVFDALETGPFTAIEVAERCGCDAAATEKLLRALYACKYLKYTENRFELAAISRRWISRKRPDSLHAAILHRNLDLRFMNFEEYLQRGKTQEFHSALSAEDWRIYHEGQASHAAQMVDEVVERASLPRNAKDLLDLGGAHGLFSVAFCRRYRDLRARVIDLEITSGDMESKRASDVSRNRVEFEVGDIRRVQLPSNSFDAALLANVVHHFDESTNRRLIQRVAEALRPEGVVIVIEAVRPRSLKETGQLEGLMDLYFGATSGVGLWTIEDIRDWSRNAGLVLSPAKTMRGMPFCKIQVARKASLTRSRTPAQGK
jgi:SAM-dependent methyltransferase